jgi:hypothetical protein
MGHIIVAAVSIAGFLSITQGQASAVECPADSQIYVNPNLAPQRPIVTRQQLEMTMANPYASDVQKKNVSDFYYNQNQPIQLPYRDGIVLISPHNPCVQQYLGK